MDACLRSMEDQWSGGQVNKRCSASSPASAIMGSDWSVSTEGNQGDEDDGACAQNQLVH